VENSRDFILLLFKEIAGDCQKSFNTVFEQYYERLLNYCIHYVRSRETAEEIVSDVFVKIWQGRKKLKNIQKPDVYLFTSVRNNALNYLRTFSSGKVVYLEASQETILHWDDPEKELEKKEIRVKFQHAIESLPEQSKLIFRLVKEEGLKCREVAEILQISTRSVENQVFRAIKKLDKILMPFIGKKTAVKKTETGISLLLFIILLISLL